MIAVLTHQLAQHKRQNSALVVILDFNRRIDAQLERDTFRAAVRAMNHQRDILLRNDARFGTFEIEGFAAVEFQRGGIDPVLELAGQHAHAGQVGAVDALEALGDDGFHAEQRGALGGPVAAGAGAVFFSGKIISGMPSPDIAWPRRR